MAVWYDKLYTGANAALIYEKIHNSIESEQYIPGVYLITLASNEREQLDIYDSIQLYLPALKRRLEPIIGVACGHEEALSLFKTIADDVYSKTGRLMIRKYFEEMMGLDKTAIPSE